MTETTNGDQTRSLTTQLGVAAGARLMLNTARRFAYPFADALSHGLGVPLTAVTTLIAANQVNGLLSPLFGPLSDRRGHRAVMLAGIGALTLGMLAGWILPRYSMIMAALFLAGLGKSLFDPALQAYVGERVPYAQRGRAVGLIEFSWSGSTLLGIPLIGLLIERFGWRSPFLLLGALGFLSLLALRATLPGNRVRAGEPAGTTPPTTFRTLLNSWRGLLAERPAATALGFSLLISIAADNLFVVYGSWLKAGFGLSTAGVGFATLAIGAAEVLGEMLTASLADNIGLKRALAGGVALSGLGYLLLPLSGRALMPALAALFFVFVTFEFTIVTSISLLTELLPEARATLLSANIAALSLGRIIGALIGGRLWTAGGIAATGAVSGILHLGALGLLLWGLRRWRGRA
ncbi:MAG: MFS transporter [Anaerolineae bacterium]